MKTFLILALLIALLLAVGYLFNTTERPSWCEGPLQYTETCIGWTAS